MNGFKKRLERLEAAVSGGTESEADRLLREELAGMSDLELREALARAEAECKAAGIPLDEPPPGWTAKEWADLQRARLLSGCAGLKAQGITLAAVVEQVDKERRTGPDPSGNGQGQAPDGSGLAKPAE